MANLPIFTFWPLTKQFQPISFFSFGTGVSKTSISIHPPNTAGSLCFSFQYTAISRKVVGKNVHATTPKGNMGYDQYTVSNDCSCRTYFCCFLLALTNVCPWPLMPFFQFLWRTGQTKPPTIPFGIVACPFSDNLSRNSCMFMKVSSGRACLRTKFW